MHDAYQAFQEGSRLLAGDNAHAAAVLLERARELEPDKASIREALARAYFRTGRFSESAAEFEATIERDPVNDYAYFGLGLCAMRTGELEVARGSLRLALAMKPGSDDYQHAFDEVTRRLAEQADNTAAPEASEDDQ